MKIEDVSMCRFPGNQRAQTGRRFTNLGRGNQGYRVSPNGKF